MFAITVTEKGGDQRRMEFDKSEITIGRVQGNDIILPKGNVSKRHARIVLKDGKFIIVDLKSTNGTYVNGRKITSPLVVKEADKIYIGDFILGVEENARAMSEPLVEPPPPPAPEPVRPELRPEPPPPVRAEPPPVRPEPPLPVRPEPPLPVRAEPPLPVRPEPPLPVRPEPPAVRPEPPAPVRAEPPRPPAPEPVRVPEVAAAGVAVAPRPQPMPPQPTLDDGAAPRPRPPRPAPGAKPARPRLVGAGAPRRVARGAPLPGARRGVQLEPLDPKVVKLLELQRQILDRLIARLDLDNIPVDRLGDEDLWARAESAIVDLVETLDSAGEVPNYVDQDTLIKETLNEALGLGALEDLLADEAIDEIMVDRRDRIIISKGGQWKGSGKAFSSDDTFRRVVERMVAPTGQLISESNPLVDVRLRDGSRLAAAVPPVAVRGACLTLRKPSVNSYSLADLIAGGTLSAEMGDFLSTCVNARRNVLVCGAPGSGKSAVLGALVGAAPEGERIVSVEEVAELTLGREDWIALEARPGDGNGVRHVDLETLLRSALRMRPDRLVVGDVRGGEALELVSAMASSSDGTIAAIAGDGAEAALGRLAAMARLGAPGATLEAVREVIAAAVDVVVHVARYADGVFRVTSVDELVSANADGFELQQLFCFRGPGGEGGFAAAGVIPAFYGELEARGIPADTSIFRS